jgi:hypothetical protein
VGSPSFLRPHLPSQIVGTSKSFLHQTHITLSATMAEPNGEEAVRSRAQQPVLARHRTKEQVEQNKKTQQSPGFFPMGYKEGFSQWVSHDKTAFMNH